MAVIYLEPRDLTAAQAAEILRYLNLAVSASEIASRIEFAGELDIGPRLAERLLRARAALGGKFQSLEQVAAVPLIGPERFTEVCVGLLGLDPSAPLHGLLDGQKEELFARLARLEGGEHGPGGPRVELSLEVTPQPAWLGQALEIAIRVVDSNGDGLSGRRVTVEASSGMLESAFGYTVRRRRALDVLSGVDGSAHLRLHGPTLEPLSLAQEAALGEALAKLDAKAESPHLLHSGFVEIANLYSSEREHVLRRAVDIYARQYRAAFFEQLNAGNLGHEWPFECAVVRVDCHPERGGSQGLAQAVVVVEWKNWVGAWFEFLRDYLAERSKLAAAFKDAKGSGATGYRLVDSLIGEAHGFVADQRGLAAEWVSQRVVKDAMTRFLGNELEGVDEPTQSELFAHLEVAAEQLTRAHRGAIAMVNQTRIDLGDKIKLTDLHFANELSSMKLENAQRFDAVDAKIVGAETQFSGQLATALGAVRTEISGIRTDLGVVRNEVDVVRGNVTRVEGDLGSVKSSVTRVEGDVEKVKVDVGKVKLDVDTLGPGGGRR